jgi:putative phosphotransacetylase
MKILVEVSARHVHLDQDTANVLFGKNYVFKVKRELSQPGQYLYEEKVDLKNGERFIKNISVLGPLREKTQVEISLTDARKLGVCVPINESGNIKGSPGCILMGPKGELNMMRGVIASKRHLHIPENLHKEIGLKNGDTVKVKIESKNRALIFDDVVARVHRNFNLALHIDTDEGNAANCNEETFCEIVQL